MLTMVNTVCQDKQCCSLLSLDQLSTGSPGVWTACVSIYWDSKLVCFVLPNGTAGWVIVTVDGVIEVHDTFFAVPVQTIGNLHSFWSQQLQP